MNTNLDNNTCVEDENKCRNCGKKLPASKFCMYCGCNNKIEETENDDVKNSEDDLIVNDKIVNNISSENGYFASNKLFIIPVAVFIVSFILLGIGFLFGGFNGLFAGSVIEDDTIPSDVKILSDKDKNIYYLENGKVNFSDIYTDKEDEEEFDAEKEKYFPTEKEAAFLDEINENEIIDFDFTDAFNDYGNKMLFLSKDKLFVVESGVIEVITLNDTTKSNSAAVSYFNHDIYADKYSKNKKYVKEDDYKYFDYDDSGYNELLYGFSEKNDFSYFGNGGYFSNMKLEKSDVKVSNFNIKNKKLYYYDNGTFIFGDDSYIYILNRKGVIYKDNGIVSDDKTITAMNIKHIFKYDDYQYVVVTNTGKMYDFYYNITDKKFKYYSDEEDSSDNIVISLFSSISFDNLTFKSIVSLILLLAGFILLGINLYLKMHSDYVTKMLSGMIVLGVPFSVFLIMFSVITFKSFMLNLINGFGIGFIVANFFISFMDIMCFILNKIRVNTLFNYILSFILFIVICLLSLDYNFILLLLLVTHIVWFIYVNNEIEFNRTYRIRDKKIYYIVSFVSLLLICGGLFLGYCFLPDFRKETLIKLLPFIIFILATFAPSIYLQKNFDFYMYLRLIFMGIFMYLTPSIINFIIEFFGQIGSSEGTGEFLGYIFKYIIIILILLALYIGLAGLVHIITRYVVSLVTKKIKMEGFLLQTTLAIFVYVIVGGIALAFGIPLIDEIYKLLFKLFFSDKLGGVDTLL